MERPTKPGHQGDLVSPGWFIRSFKTTNPPPTCISTCTLCLPSQYCPFFWSRPLHCALGCIPFHLLKDIMPASLPSAFCVITVLSLSPSFIIPINIQTCCNFSDLYKTNTTTLLILHPHPATNQFLRSLLKKMFRRAVYVHSLQFSIFLDLFQ